VVSSCTAGSSSCGPSYRIAAATRPRDLGNIGTDLMIEVIRHSGRSTKPLIRRP
jgi:acetaldehyde dehydrogenase (acetylating)